MEGSVQDRSLPEGALLPQEARARAYSYRHDGAVPDFDDSAPLIVFDGVCGLCSGFARFVIARDRARVFRFTHAQSALGTALFRHYGLDETDFETSLLIEDGWAFGRLEAFAGVLQHFRAHWRGLAMALMLLPRPLRDWLYARVARNRYALFGRYESCRVPSGLGEGRFLP